MFSVGPSRRWLLSPPRDRHHGAPVSLPDNNTGKLCIDQETGGITTSCNEQRPFSSSLILIMGSICMVCLICSAVILLLCSYKKRQMNISRSRNANFTGISARSTIRISQADPHAAALAAVANMSVAPHHHHHHDHPSAPNPPTVHDSGSQLPDQTTVIVQLAGDEKALFVARPASFINTDCRDRASDQSVTDEERYKAESTVFEPS